MRFSISDNLVLSRPPEGPIAHFIGPFAAWLTSRGYTVGTMKHQVRLAGDFSRWLQQKRIRLESITADHPMLYLSDRALHQRPQSGDSGTLRHLLDFLRGEEAIAKVQPESSPLPIDQHLLMYDQYLREVRALSPATIGHYHQYARDFLMFRFGAGEAALSQLHAADVIAFVRRKVSQLKVGQAKCLTTALRSFLSYVRYRGDVVSDLTAAVPTVANWSLSSIPRAIGRDEMNRLLASIDRQAPLGLRDYAMILLLARLGVRSGEVVSLELDDIDWVAGEIHVVGKNGRRNVLPLPVDVGEAIAAYLQKGRPCSQCRRVFLRAIAPIQGFGSACGLRSAVRNRLIHAGIQSPTKGTHQFRHALASEMLRGGASLGEIGEMLGHNSPQTTMIYAKVDLDALRPLALPWPGTV